MADDSESPQARSRPAWRLPALIALIVAALVGLYALAGFKLAPRLITNGAADYVRENYRRELTLRDVQFNPFTLELRIGAMSLPDQDARPMLSWERLYVNFAGWRSLVNRAIAFEDIHFTGPRLDLVRRADNGWNVLDLLPPEPEQPPPPTDGKPPRLIVDRFEVEGGAGSFTDLTQATPKTEEITAIAFSLQDFNTLLSGNHFDLRAASPNVRAIHWQGALGIAPLASSGSFEIEGFDLPGFMRQWMPGFTPAIGSGTLQLAGSYEFAMPKDGETIRLLLPRIAVSDLALRARNAPEDWVAIPALTISDTSIDAVTQQVSVGSVALDRARITALLDANGNLNLLDYLPPEEPAAAPGPEAAPATAAAPAEDDWRVTLGELAVNAAEVDFTSLVASREPMRWRLQPANLSVKGFAIPASAPLAVSVTTGVDATGKVGLQGQYDLDGGVGEFDADVSGIELKVLQPAFDEQTLVALKRGVAGLKGKLTVGGPGELKFAGQATIGNLQVADRLNGTDLIRWRDLKVNGLAVTLEPLRVDVRELLFQGPYAQLVIEPNGTTNLTVALSPPGTVFPAAGSEPEPEEKPESKPKAQSASKSKGGKAAPPPEPPPPPPAEALPVEIRRVRIADGSMNFTDRTLRPEFSTGILEMSGTIAGLSGKPGTVADVKIDGKVDRYAPVAITGSVNYFAAETLTDIRMSFSNLEMTTFSPYSGKFAGYRIEKGKLNLTTNYKVVNNQLDANHKIVIDQLQLGEKVESADAVSLPLKLAVALLKDRNGVIDIDLPITGSLDDPQFRIGPIIWKMFKNLLVKIVSSPFSFIGGLFGGDGEDMQYIDFEPGRSDLDERDTAKLTALRTAMIDRPGLSVDIPMVHDEARDAPVLLERHWQAMLDKAAVTRFGEKAQQPGFVASASAVPQDHRKLMVTAYRQQFGKDPELPKPDRKNPEQKDLDPDAFAAVELEKQLRPTVSVSGEDLQALGKARADAIQDVLLKDGGVEPSRVFVILQAEAPPATPEPATSEPTTPEPVSAEPTPAIRAQLSLK